MDSKSFMFESSIMDVSKFCSRNIVHDEDPTTISSPTSDTQWSGYGGRFEEAHETFNPSETLSPQPYAENGTTNEGPRSSDASSAQGFGQGSLFSKYAMDAIFKNLIYPDVSQSCSLSLDSLLSVSGDTQTHHSLSLHPVPDKSRNGKRKRIHMINNAQDSEHGLSQTGESSVTVSDRRPFNVRRTLVHKRVRQLICDM